MTRFILAVFLLAFVIGCQTAAHVPQKTFVAHTQSRTDAMKQFWSQTAKRFNLQNNHQQNKDGQDHSFAFNQFTTDMLTVGQPTPLYRPGSIFLSPMLIFPDQESPAGEDAVMLAESTPESSSTISSGALSSGAMSGNALASTASPRPVTAMPQAVQPFLIQSGDSEGLQSLLREIAVMPSDRRRVDDETLTDLLISFRNGVMNSDVEEEYLALLRRRVLPESTPARTPASRSVSTENQQDIHIAARSRERVRDVDWDYHEDDFYYDEPIPHRASPHSPNRRALPRDDYTLADTRQANTRQGHHEPMPSGPSYPHLTQIPGPPMHGGIVQTAYQAPYIHPASVHQPHFATSPPGYGAGDWQSPARQAIEQLRYRIENTPNGRTPHNEMKLRTLEAVLGNRREAALPMQSADRTLNTFMQNQALGLAELLDETSSNPRTQYVAAAYRFNEGLLELQKICPIQLRNVTFISSWFGFGQFIPRPTDEFHPGDSFKVYMEFEYPTARPVADGFEYSVSLSYDIRDIHGHIQHRNDLGPMTTRSLSHRRDQCMEIAGTMPISLAPGQYFLRISMTDLNDDSQQHTEEQIPFRIAPAMGGADL